jgi:hypothetical protein
MLLTCRILRFPTALCAPIPRYLDCPADCDRRRHCTASSSWAVEISAPRHVTLRMYGLRRSGHEETLAAAMQQICRPAKELGMSEYTRRFAENGVDMAVLPRLERSTSHRSWRFARERVEFEKKPGQRGAEPKGRRLPGDFLPFSKHFFGSPMRG